jgi:hypothetical protein
VRGTSDDEKLITTRPTLASASRLYYATLAGLSDEAGSTDNVNFALNGTDDQVGPACSNVPVPLTIATDDEFRNIYEQGYRHALSDVRKWLKGQA